MPLTINEAAADFFEALRALGTSKLGAEAAFVVKVDVHLGGPPEIHPTLAEMGTEIEAALEAAAKAAFPPTELTASKGT